jgi:flagellar M-ring protein FliF
MDKLSEQYQEFFGPLSPAQRTMFGGMILLVIVFVGLLFYWALKPDYTLLFGSLQPDAAGEIIEELDSQGVRYRLEDNGRSIYVQSDRVHQLRINLASSGFTRNDVQGYELFDANALGMTDFMQQVNKKRALEGELARSINSLEQVEFTRIHLVLPERSPFQQSRVEASASVVLTLKRGMRLRSEQVEGITSLIAGSVEGLDQSSVTVLDQNGNRLTDGLDSHSDFASGSMQMQLRKKTEAYLTERGQSMLDRVLGPGNSILRVSAEHDFDRLVRESDIIDPESRIVISEERRSETDRDESSQLVPIDEFTPIDRRGESVVTSSRDNERTTQTRNYEVNKTRELYEKTQGEIRRVTASVLINYKQRVGVNENGEQVLTNEPYTDREIEEFREVVRVALGIQPGRGDELSITQIEFYDPTANDPRSYFMDQPTPWNDIIRWSVILFTFLLIVALIYNIRKKMGTQETGLVMGYPRQTIEEVPMDEGDEESTPKLEDMTDEEAADFIDKKISGQARKQLQQKAYVMEEIKDFVELKPAEAAQVIRAMMTADED